MTTEIAIILLIDGIANGAIYLLAGLGLVLIFSVTRVVFVPFGDITAFCALSIAAFELGKVPGAIWVVAILALVATMMDAAGHIRSGEIKRIPRSFLVYGLLPLIPCVLAWLAAGQPLPHAVQIVLALALVLPIAPLLDRIAFRPAADASVLVLLTISRVRSPPCSVTHGARWRRCRLSPAVSSSGCSWSRPGNPSGSASRPRGPCAGPRTR